MRAILPVLFFGSLIAAAQAAEPRSWHVTMPLQGTTQQVCLQRSRDAMTSAAVSLAEASQGSQYGVQGDNLVLAICAQSEPTILVILVAGPQAADARNLGQRLRDSITRPAAPVSPGGTKAP
ncbi:hypothetical protein [Plastoroseomonas arctica]|uniref:Uncharacterized protein n=1 Tax=Plastoroseomonas arctica TaxID=1509237 RepID=A0AAF1JZN4_9PROT|nr:hypothetical protein [Plastoroseomonas arctica]MBR0656941.1 hypothetical protein [Plastoroseomonas arctica]